LATEQQSQYWGIAAIILFLVVGALLLLLVKRVVVKHNDAPETETLETIPSEV